ncbi:Rid family hydrolase [Salipiger sp. P9]|uniref:Rid family hydrolase n=1 Tax=Salipiger pentaromativorans TaxID=2943193 RepID=UPI002157FB7C|nr:Rid family hydrolase [Salipiger pentaromativorans]MCR8547594.1 Rid family hydrolase [Salipiger pentaromativorans]
MSRVERLDAGSATAALASYSRAVRVGDLIFVSGALARLDTGEISHPGDAKAQAEVILDRIAAALATFGAGLDDVVETKVYVADISRWEGVGEAHGAAFRRAMPATTLLEIARFAHPDALVEISAVAAVTAG